MKLGENTNILYPPKAKEASKYPFRNNNGSPARAQKMGKEGENWGKIGDNFARHTNVLSLAHGTTARGRCEGWTWGGGGHRRQHRGGAHKYKHFESG